MIDSKPKHTVGTLKEVTRFAFYPMILESRFIWLERYKVVKRYCYYIIFDEENSVYIDQYHWATIDRKIIR